jgi:beta-glucosidase/6-phospho-beta-glucosidase/beta-galactosidase
MHQQEILPVQPFQEQRHCRGSDVRLTQTHMAATAMGWAIVPWGCGNPGLDRSPLWSSCVVLTENGCAFRDVPGKDGVEDERRIAFPMRTCPRATMRSPQAWTSKGISSGH